MKLTKTEQNLIRLKLFCESHDIISRTTDAMSYDKKVRRDLDRLRQIKIKIKISTCN